MLNRGLVAQSPLDNGGGSWEVAGGDGGLSAFLATLKQASC